MRFCRHEYFFGKFFYNYISVTINDKCPLMCLLHSWIHLTKLRQTVFFAQSPMDFWKSWNFFYVKEFHWKIRKCNFLILSIVSRLFLKINFNLMSSMYWIQSLYREKNILQINLPACKQGVIDCWIAFLFYHFYILKVKA